MSKLPESEYVGLARLALCFVAWWIFAGLMEAFFM